MALTAQNYCCFTCVPLSILLQVAPDCKYLQTTLAFEVEKEKFTCVGKTLLSPGFTQAITWQALADDEKLPDVRNGEMFRIEEVGI